MKRLGQMDRNSRGFRIVRFHDYNGVLCSLQQSSLALTDEPGTGAIWLGSNDAQPKIMAVHAERLGVKTTETCGWVPYPIPEDVLLHTRMHLTKPQVKALIGHLQNWVDKGTF